MNSMQSRNKRNKAHKRKKAEGPSPFNTKLFIALGLLLVILLMKKYDLSIAHFNVDSVYQVVYYNEDLSPLKRLLSNFIQTDSPSKETLNQNSSEDQPLDVEAPVLTPDVSSEPATENDITDLLDNENTVDTPVTDTVVIN